MPKATHSHEVLCGGTAKDESGPCGNVFSFDVTLVDGDYQATSKTGPKCPECGTDAGHTTVAIKETK